MVGYTNKLDDKDHVALVKGEIDASKPILVRVHSECLTGDIFGSKRCDCGPQLHSALHRIEEEGSGIGLINKLKAYELQEQGMDTVQANNALGFEDDLREYRMAAGMLKDLGVDQIKLLTNNPRKINGLIEYGMNIVERVPHQMKEVPENEKYLHTKAEKSGHLLHF